MANDPAAVPGLRARYKASTISSPPADGGTLQTWTDTAGNSYSATQATAGNRPIYRTSGAFLPNSQPVVEFVAATPTFLTAAVPQNTATTRFVVARIKETPPTIPYTFVSSPLQCLVLTNGKFATAIENVTWLVQDSGQIATLAANTWYCLTLTDDGANVDTTYVNGTQDAQVSVAHTNTGTSLSIGQKVATDEPLNGYIAEIIEYSAVLSASDRAVVHSYIQDTYGITVSDYNPGNPTLEPGAFVNVTRANPKN